MPQMNDAASVCSSIRMRYTLWTCLDWSVIERSCRSMHATTRLSHEPDALLWCLHAALRIALVVGLLAAASSTVTAQSPSGEPLTLQAALDRALAANPTIAAARLRSPIDIAGLEVARERLNPEASIEFQKETPRRSYGVSVPLELGGKRAKRIAVGEATVRAGEAKSPSSSPRSATMCVVPTSACSSPRRGSR